MEIHYLRGPISTLRECSRNAAMASQCLTVPAGPRPVRFLLLAAAFVRAIGHRATLLPLLYCPDAESKATSERGL